MIISSVLPLRGHHQGGTPVTVHGAGLAGLGACCWDHHPHLLSSQVLGSLTSFPLRSESIVIGGDGVVDETTQPELLNDTAAVCTSYASVPGYTHTDDLLLSSNTSCHNASLLDTRADFQFYLDTIAMQLATVTPRGGPLQGAPP